MKAITCSIVRATRRVGMHAPCVGRQCSAPADGARSVLCTVRMPRDFVSVPFSIWGPFLRQIGHRETHMTRDAYTRFVLVGRQRRVGTNRQRPFRLGVRRAAVNALEMLSALVSRCRRLAVYSASERYCGMLMAPRPCWPVECCSIFRHCTSIHR